MGIYSSFRVVLTAKNLTGTGWVVGEWVQRSGARVFGHEFSLDEKDMRTSLMNDISYRLSIMSVGEHPTLLHMGRINMILVAELTISLPLHYV